MTESVVVTDAESAGGNQEFDLVANTTGSMKVIITKDQEIINQQEMVMGQPILRLNEQSELGNTDDLNVGKVLTNENSEIVLKGLAIS